MFGRPSKIDRLASEIYRLRTRIIDLEVEMERKCLPEYEAGYFGASRLGTLPGAKGGHDAKAFIEYKSDKDLGEKILIGNKLFYRSPVEKMHQDYVMYADINIAELGRKCND